MKDSEIALLIYNEIPKEIRHDIIGACWFDENDRCHECGIGGEIGCYKDSENVKNCELQQILYNIIWNHQIADFMDNKIVLYSKIAIKKYLKRRSKR